MTVDEILIAAWLRGAPDADTSRGFVRGFWQDVARTAVEIALAGDVNVALSFRPTMCSRGDHEGKPETRAVKGLDVSKLEFRL